MFGREIDILCDGLDRTESIFKLGLLYLCGQDLHRITDVIERPLMDFSLRTILTLEYCPGLGPILDLLIRVPGPTFYGLLFNLE